MVDDDADNCAATLSDGKRAASASDETIEDDFSTASATEKMVIAELLDNSSGFAVTEANDDIHDDTDDAVASTLDVRF